MTEAQIGQTKEKILLAARELFAVKGFEGASVREIARTAEVNIAAVNYHFSSKEKLFHHVMDMMFEESERAITEHRAESPNESVEDLTVWIFHYFNRRSDVLRSVFKMLLSEKGWGEEIVCGPDGGNFGPPGGQTLASAILAHIQKDVSEQDMFWAVKMIFSNLVHMSLMYTNHFCKLPKQQAPYHDLKTLESDIRRLVGVIMRDL